MHANWQPSHSTIMWHAYMIKLTTSLLTWITWLQVIKLARKLPTGDVSALKTDAGKEEEEPLDENDLT